MIEVGSPITVRVAVGLGVASGVIGPKNKSKVFCVTEVLGDAMVGKPEYLTDPAYRAKVEKMFEQVYGTQEYSAI